MHRFIIYVMIGGFVLILSCRDKEKRDYPGSGDTLQHQDSTHLDDSSGQAAYLKYAPAWFTEPPSHDGFLYTVATAKSRQLDIASGKALTLAQIAMAKKLESISGTAEAPKGADGEDTPLLRTELRNSVVKKQTRIREGKFWRVFILLEMPVYDKTQDSNRP